MTKTMKIGSATVTVTRPNLSEAELNRNHGVAAAGLRRYAEAMRKAEEKEEEKKEPAAAGE